MSKIPKMLFAFLGLLFFMGGCMESALRDAIRKGDAVAVVASLKEGADVNAKDEKGRTPLGQAVERGDPAVVSALLKAGAGAGAPPALRKKAALLAAGCKDWNTLNFFKVATSKKVSGCVKAGADVNAKNKRGETPLHTAVKVENSAVVVALSEAGARAGAPPALRKKAALLAAGCKDWNTLNFFKVATSKKVSGCVKAGADVNARDEKGHTLLRRAVEKGDQVVVAGLLKAGADVNARDKEGYAPLHRAALLGDREVAVALLKAGADPNAKDIIDGNTPLHLAKKGDRDLLAVLLQAGANPNARNAEGFTFRRTSLKNQAEADALALKAARERELKKQKTEAAARRAALKREKERKEREQREREAARQAKRERERQAEQERRAARERAQEAKELGNILQNTLQNILQIQKQ